jgi:hypothetical protein
VLQFFFARSSSARRAFSASSSAAGIHGRPLFWPGGGVGGCGYDGYQAKTSRRIPLVVLKNVTSL